MCDEVNDQGKTICQRQPSDWVIGWNNHDNYDGPWYLLRENGDDLSSHATHNDAMREAQLTDPHVQMFHEADGGGCLGSFEETYYDDNDGLLY